MFILDEKNGRPVGPDGLNKNNQIVAHDGDIVKEFLFIEQMRERYLRALQETPPPGERHTWILRVANYGALSGLPVEQAVQEITAALPRQPNPPNEVVDAVAKAFRELGAGTGICNFVRMTNPVPAPLSTREFIRRGNWARVGDLRAASPRLLDWGDDPRLDAIAQLQACFHPNELVFTGKRYEQTIRTAAEWVGLFSRGVEIPPLLCSNPLKPEGGTTAGGKLSPRCDDAVAVFRHAVAEFDGLSLAEQLAFWMGFGLDAVSSVTYSGGKSLHVLLRVDAADAMEWNQEVREGLFRRRLIPLGCDGSCRNPSRLTRLAGAARLDKGGNMQRLLFVRPPLAGWQELTTAAEKEAAR